MSGTRARSGPRSLLAVAAALGLLAALALPALGGEEIDWATVTGYAEGTAANNEPGEFGENCEKLATPEGGFGDTYELPALAEGMVYSLVVVKSGAEASNPGTVNTLFADPSAGETVWADTSGNGAFEEADKGISHIIVCTEEAPDETPTPTPSPSESQLEEEETPTPTPREDEKGGTPTPTAGELPDTSAGELTQVPATMLSLVMLAALAAIAYARLARQR